MVSLVSEKIFKLSGSREPMSDGDEQQKYGCAKRSTTSLTLPRVSIAVDLSQNQL